MHVGLRIEGDVVVDHQANALDIEPAGRHIGGHQHIHLAAFEPFDRAFPLGLGHIAIEHCHVVAVLLQGFSHGDGDRLGAGKDNDAFTCFGFEYALQGGQLVGRMHHQKALTDEAGIGSFLPDRDLGRAVEVLLGYAPDFGRHGGGEQHNLAFFRQLFQHPFDIVDEAHAQHLIGLIEHQGPQIGEVQGALAHVIHHPTRGTHHDLHTALELVNLIAEIGAAVNRQGANPIQLGGVAVEGIGHLQGQFPGWGKHQHLGLALGWIEAGQHGQGKGRRLASAGLGLTHQVAAEHQLGDGCLLDRRGLPVANCL